MSKEKKSGDSCKKPNGPHVKLYNGSAILTDESGNDLVVWHEGRQTENAESRYRKITEEFNNGFLDKKIEEARSINSAQIFENQLTDECKELLKLIVDSINAKTGRALVEILVLQLSIKTISPEQDIRLHKGSKVRSKFSWQEGISMRKLDDSYVAPALRRHDLLRMNRYGAFMTRSFAENYPYTIFYKAEIMGEKSHWLKLIDRIESKEVDSNAALLYTLHLLDKASESFRDLAQEAIEKTNLFVSKNNELVFENVIEIINDHISNSESRARLLEIAMHSLLQAEQILNVELPGLLKPLMPMRTANLKHGNIGDIELIVGDNVVEAWDAKYDNPYLSDALEELSEKIKGKDVTELEFGYVLMPFKKEYQDVLEKADDLKTSYSIDIKILGFDEWAYEQKERASKSSIDEKELAKAWVTAYVESLALRRLDIAPIDEPTNNWLDSYLYVLSKSM